MTKIIECDSPEEAYKYARKLAAENGYNWFRGQADSSWKLVSSRNRTGDNEDDEDEENEWTLIIGKLIKYFESIDGYSKYVHDWRKLLAVAQHFGIKTSFIDFTDDLDVAFYFATSEYKAERKPCLFLLNTNEFNKCIEIIKKVHPGAFEMEASSGVVDNTPELCDMIVEDLWRLHAQKGKFLIWNYPQIEEFFDFYGFNPFCRIHFTNDPNFNTLSKDYIYPERISELEQRVIVFLQQLEEERGRAIAAKWLKDLKGSHEITFVDPLAQDDDLNDDWWCDRTRWTIDPGDNFHEVNTDLEISLNIENPTTLSFSDILEVVDYSFEMYPKSLGYLRKINLIFRFNSSDCDKDLIFSKNLQTFFDGVKRLPYDDQEIIYGLAKVIFLQISKTTGQASFPYDEYIQIEMTLKHMPDFYSRAYVKRSDIVNCFSQAFEFDNLSKFLQGQRPFRIFNFNKFKTLLIQEIVPYQIVHRGKGEVFFNPCEIKIFGIP